MTFKRIGVRFALQISFVIVVVMILIFMTFQSNTTAMVDDILQEQAQIANNHLQESLAQMQNTALSQAESWAQHSAVLHAAKTGNASGLKALNTLGLDMITVTDMKGTVIARANSDQKGDSLAYQAVISKVMAEGVAASSMETGNVVGLAIRAAAPIKDEQGRNVGILSCAYDLSNPIYVEQIKEQNNCEVGIYLGDARINTTLKDEEGNYRIGSTLEPEIVEMVLLNGDTYSGRIDLFGVTSIVMYTPFEIDGKIAGMLLCSVDIEQVLNLQNRTTWMMILVIVITTIGICGIITFLSHIYVTKPLRAINQTAGYLEKGELTKAVKAMDAMKIRREDEVGMLAQALRSTCQSLQAYISELNACMQALSSGRLDIASVYPFAGDFVSIKDAINVTINNFRIVMSQLMDIASEISMGAEELAKTAAMVSVSNEEQSESIAQIAETMREIRIRAEQAAQGAVTAAAETSEIREDMDENSKQVAGLNDAMGDIDKASLRIAEIMQSIEDLTMQTKILAVNTSIEAAKAGKDGKSFSVIAKEVRDLATRSAQAAIHSEELANDTIEAVKKGKELNLQMAQSFEVTRDHTHEVNVQISQTQGDMQQQAAAIGEIDINIDNVVSRIHDNASASTKLAAASQQLAAQAENLHQMTSAFKLQ